MANVAAALAGSFELKSLFTFERHLYVSSSVCVPPDRTRSCTSMFNVAMSNTSYPKISNNTFLSYHCVRTRSGGHKAPYLAGDEDLIPLRVKKSEPKTDYLAPCN